jgi:hypothetical protein
MQTWRGVERNRFRLQRVEKVLAITGIEKAADRRAGKFSLGMSQRLGIAAALLGDPRVLLLDEPVNGLHRPDVSVVDVRMPPTHTDESLRAAITARSHLPGAPMLVLSQYVEASYAGNLLADGFADQPECLIDPVAVTPSRAILAGSGGYFQHDHSPLLGGAGWAADRDSVKAASASAGRVSRTATSARSPASLA